MRQQQRLDKLLELYIVLFEIVVLQIKQKQKLGLSQIT